MQCDIMLCELSFQWRGLRRGAKWRNGFKIWHVHNSTCIRLEPSPCLLESKVSQRLQENANSWKRCHVIIHLTLLEITHGHGITVFPSVLEMLVSYSTSGVRTRLSNQDLILESVRVFVRICRHSMEPFKCFTFAGGNFFPN